MTIGELASFVGRGRPPTYSGKDTFIRAINQKCIRDGRVDLAYARSHEESVPVREEALLRPGDVCVTSTGTGTIGRVGLWTHPDGETVYFADSHITIIRVVGELADARFIAETVAGPDFQERMSLSCFIGSTSQVELSRSALVEQEVSLPPLAEQQRIATLLAAMDEAAQAALNEAGAIVTTKRALLTTLLSGGG